MKFIVQMPAVTLTFSEFGKVPEEFQGPFKFLLALKAKEMVRKSFVFRVSYCVRLR